MTEQKAIKEVIKYNHKIEEIAQKCDEGEEGANFNFLNPIRCNSLLKNWNANIRYETDYTEKNINTMSIKKAFETINKIYETVNKHY